MENGEMRTVEWVNEGMTTREWGDADGGILGKSSGWPEICGAAVLGYNTKYRVQSFREIEKRTNIYNVQRSEISAEKTFAEPQGSWRPQIWGFLRAYSNGNWQPRIRESWKKR